MTTPTTTTTRKSVPTTAPSTTIFPSITNYPSITGVPTRSVFPTRTNSPSTTPGSSGHTSPQSTAPTTAVITNTSNTTTEATIKTTSSITPLSPSPLRTMPTRPSSSPVTTSASPTPPIYVMRHILPTVSMIPTASSSPTISRFPTLSPTSDVGVADANPQPSTTGTNSSSSSSLISSMMMYGYNQSCPGFTTTSIGGTGGGLAQTDIVFTYMIQTTLSPDVPLQPQPSMVRNNNMTNTTATTSYYLLQKLEKALLDYAANVTLTCQDLSPFHIYQLSYPSFSSSSSLSSSFISNLAPCSTTTVDKATAAKSCWIVQTHMRIITDNDDNAFDHDDTSANKAKYAVLAALQQQLDASTTTTNQSLPLLTTLLPQLVSTHYLGPNPQSTGSLSPTEGSSSTSQSDHHHSAGFLLPLTIVIIVLAVMSIVALILLWIWIKRKQHGGEMDDDHLYPSKTSSSASSLRRNHHHQRDRRSYSSTSSAASRSSSGGATTNNNNLSTMMDAELEMEMAEISELLTRSRRRLEEHPPLPSWDSSSATSQRTQQRQQQRGSTRSSRSGTSGSRASSSSQSQQQKLSSSKYSSVLGWSGSSLASYGTSEPSFFGSHDDTSRNNSFTASRQEEDSSWTATDRHRRSSSSSSSPRKNGSTLLSQDNNDDDSRSTRRRAECILEASASFHSRNTWTSSLETESTAAGVGDMLLMSPSSDDISVRETLGITTTLPTTTTTTTSSMYLVAPTLASQLHELDSTESSSPTTAMMTISKHARDGLLKDTKSSSPDASRNSKHDRGSSALLPDLIRPTRGTREVYQRTVQQSTLL